MIKKEKIFLISPTPQDISAFGIRALSSFLKSYGYDVKLIFLPGDIDKLRLDGSYKYEYNSETLYRIEELVKGCQVIGLSFMTYYYDRAVQIAKYLRKKTNSTILFGGIHPTVSPGDCLSYSDGICIGEGETPFLKLLESGIDIENTPNFIYKIKKETVQNKISPLIKDLDSLPAIDYSLEGHFVLEMNRSMISEMTEDLLRSYLPLLPDLSGKFNRVYRTMTSRGCPHECLYCINKYLKLLYQDEKFLRRRSVVNVIDELSNVVSRFGFINGIQFFDDTFFAASTEYIREFSEIYKEKINLPLYLQGSPTTITKKKLELLINAGLTLIEMGIQTGSKREAEAFNRLETRLQLKESIGLINQFQDKMIRPHYHLILDSPNLKIKDINQTLDLIMEIPTPYKLCLASLTFFPGTELHKIAKDQNMLKDDLIEIYRKAFYKFKGNYINFLIVLSGVEFFPRFILKILRNRLLIKFLYRERDSSFFSIIIKLVENTRLINAGIKSLISKDTGRIRAYLRGFK